MQLRKKCWITAALIAAGLCTSASAQQFGTLPLMVRGVGIDQNLGAQVPLELNFTDEAGQTVRLGQYFRGKPVVLALVYYECPGLCDLVLNGLAHGMEQISLDLGKDYDVVTVSFNPHETSKLAAAKKASYLEHYKRPGAQDAWHFLTGKDEAIRVLTDTVGFNYKYDPATKQFAHASGIMVLTPEGKVSRYFYGIEYKSRDFRLGLVEASNNKIGTRTDQLLLYCFHYDPTTGKYGPAIQNITRVLGSTTVLALGTFIFVMVRREKQNGHPNGKGRMA